MSIRRLAFENVGSEAVSGVIGGHRLRISYDVPPALASGVPARDPVKQSAAHCFHSIDELNSFKSSNAGESGTCINEVN
jgi:hypothetical protein